MSSSDSRPLLDPYRTLGCFLSAPLSLVATPLGLVAPTHTSFKVYSPSLTIKVQSPPFPHAVTAVSSYNEHTYLRTLNRVVKMKYHHIVGEWELKGGSTHKCTLLKFDEIILIAEENMLAMIDETTNEVKITKNPFKILGMVHPVTYINKVLIYSENHLQLVNPLSNKNLYDFPQIIQTIQENNTSISIVEASPLVDIVGIGLENGTILFVNIRKGIIVFSLRQKSAPISLAFSTEFSWLASGDSNGNVILWDLEQKKILYKMEECMSGAIDSLVFLPGLQVLTVGSSQANCIRQLRVNLEDNKILTLLRERVGNTQTLERIDIGSNNELVLSNQKETMFISFHSQCNNYRLEGMLDSKLPYHLKAKHFTVELYHNRTSTKTFKIGEAPLVGKISLSNKYYIIATARKMVKLGMSYPLEWPVPNVRHILLYNEHYIYAITPIEIIVCDFNINEQVTSIAKKNIVAPVTNHFHNLMAFGSDERSIEIWDMAKIQQGRVFNPESHGSPLCLSFTPDNRFLLSSHLHAKLLIWDIPNSQLYKVYTLEQDLIYHTFTSDNQFMVSLYRQNREANVWNNYLGKVSTNRKEESLRFEPVIKKRSGDPRSNFIEPLNEVKIDQEVFEEDIFDSIPDADDDVPEYSFVNINQWLPLVHYDEIRERNAPSTKINAPSLPFFLDFKNITEEKKKIQEEIRQEAAEQRRKAIQEQDKHLKSSENEILLDEDSKEDDYRVALESLSKLSIAEIDYQLRVFLLSPNKAQYLLKMVQVGWKTAEVAMEIKNVIMHRVVSLIGIDLAEEELAPVCSELLREIEEHTLELREKLNRCIVIADHQ